MNALHLAPALNANETKQRHQLRADLRKYYKLTKDFKYRYLVKFEKNKHINSHISIENYFENLEYFEFLPTPSNLNEIHNIICKYYLSCNIQTRLYFLAHPESFISPIELLPNNKFKVNTRFTIMKYNEYEKNYTPDINTFQVITSQEIKANQLDYLEELAYDEWNDETILNLSIPEIWNFLNNDEILNHVTQGVNCNMPDDDGNCACISADFIQESEYDDEQIQDLINDKNNIDEEPFPYTKCSCCFDTDKFLFYGSCRHACICVDCFVDLLNVRRREVNGAVYEIDPSCPICRVPYNIKQKKCIGEKVGLDEETITALYTTEEGRAEILTMIDFRLVAHSELSHNYEDDYLDDYHYFEFSLDDDDDNVEYGDLQPAYDQRTYMYIY